MVGYPNMRYREQRLTVAHLNIWYSTYSRQLFSLAFSQANFPIGYIPEADTKTHAPCIIYILLKSFSSSMLPSHSPIEYGQTAPYCDSVRNFNSAHFSTLK